METDPRLRKPELGRIRSRLFASLALLAMLSAAFPLSGQTDAQLSSIVAMAGVPDAESLDEQELERLSRFLAHPVEINIASSSKLVSSGLFTRYQAASIADYRTRNGDILSYSELAAVEGFGDETVRRLAPFISLRSRRIPGQPATDTLALRHDALLRCASRGGEWNWGMKYKVSAGEAAEASFAARTVYGGRQFPPASWSGNVVFNGRKYMGKLIVGDYAARFGQGLALWSGLSLSSLSRSSSFVRRPTGISPSWSYSGIMTHRGAAADFMRGRFVATAILSFPGLRESWEGGRKASAALMAGGNVTWYGPLAQAGVTGYYESGPLGGPWYQQGGKVSADFRSSVRGTDLFGEYAFDFVNKALAAVSGAIVPLGGDWKASVAWRCYPESWDTAWTGSLKAWTRPEDEASLSFGLEKGSACLSADCAMKVSDHGARQCKVLLVVPVQLMDKAVLTMKVTERYRPYEELLVFKTGARVDLDYSSAGLSARYGAAEGQAWTARFRMEALLCRSLGVLSYLEGGRRGRNWTAFLRGGLFRIDNWDDRIYSYERDAPGNFNVPAYYGRGYSLSAVASSKFVLGRTPFRSMKLYFRAGAVGYPFMDEPKPSRTEVKLQAVCSL